MATSTRALLVSFIAVIAAFFASGIVVSHSARGIDDEALFISRDAAPGIEVLSNLRAELRSFEVEAVRASDTADTTRVDEVRRRIDGLMAQALALPNDGTETQLIGELQADLRALDEAAERALQQARSGERQAARETLRKEARPRADRAAEVTRQLVEYDAKEARQAALRIEKERVEASRLSWELDVIAAVLSLTAGFLCFRVVRQVVRVKEENALLSRRKAEELEQFAGRVAHDILSPLSTVGMSLALAERSAPEAREALRRGNSSLERVQGIVDGLLDFARSGARPEHGARAAVRPVVVGLREELTPFAAQHQAKLDFGEVPDCGVACSPGVLLSLLGNLLRNAIKYLGNAQVREVSLRVHCARRDRVVFEVEDTGPGIPSDLGASIFDPYVRGVHTGVPGIGLGLATVKRLVESHGGAVGVRRGDKGGALFWFELNEAGASAAPVERRNARSA